MIENKYYPQIDFDDASNNTERIRALYNIVNWLARQMAIGMVPENRIELLNNMEELENTLMLPTSITFVKMTESGEIDEVTACENASMFMEWSDIGIYKIDEIRAYDGKLYRCLQDHAAQQDWNPSNTPALWKELGIAENGIPEWSQPISAVDAYMIGDEVMYKNIHYRSTIDNNTWSPEDYPQGWEIIE